MMYPSSVYAVKIKLSKLQFPFITNTIVIEVGRNSKQRPLHPCPPSPPRYLNHLSTLAPSICFPHPCSVIPAPLSHLQSLFLQPWTFVSWTLLTPSSLNHCALNLWGLCTTYTLHTQLCTPKSTLWSPIFSHPYTLNPGPPLLCHPSPPITHLPMDMYNPHCLHP